MLSPAQVREIKFSRSAIGGYKPSEVDKFLDDIQDTFREMSIKNDELEDEIKRLNRQIERFKAEESSIRKAIINSQQIADATVIDAGVKSKYILKDASNKAAKILKIAKDGAEKRMEISKQLYERSENLKTDLIKRFEEQIKFLKSISSEPVSEIEKKLFMLDETAQKFSDDHEIFSISFEDKEDPRDKFLSELAVQSGIKDKYRNSDKSGLNDQISMETGEFLRTGIR
jgi:DivIVA domain-containing protein